MNVMSKCCRYAMLTTFNEIDMTSLMAMRSQYKDVFLEKHGVKLGFMSAFVKAAASALEMVPAVNAVIDSSEIVYRDYVDISVAVSTPKGLVVPVLRNVDGMRFADVEKVRPPCAVLLDRQSASIPDKQITLVQLLCSSSKAAMLHGE
jgi:pyruvate/2-oxoglutarate dehydrogenase complex dihydrolipoamide acyltransferase (E2) component